MVPNICPYNAGAEHERSRPVFAIGAILVDLHHRLNLVKLVSVSFPEDSMHQNCCCKFVSYVGLDFLHCVSVPCN